MLGPTRSGILDFLWQNRDMIYRRLLNQLAPGNFRAFPKQANFKMAI